VKDICKKEGSSEAAFQNRGERMDIRAIVFDKDGTLADFPATFNPATAQVIEHITQGDPELMSAVAGAWDFDLETHAIRDTSVIIAGSSLDITMAIEPLLDVGDPKVYSAFLDRLYGEICQSSVVAISGVAGALKELHGTGYRMAVATNDSEANAVSQMQTLQFQGYFERIFGADSGHGPKPGPGMIEAFLDHTGLEPRQVLMVGDSTHDLDAGRSAGVMTCGVETGPAKRRELEHAADIVLASVAGLPA
jgi:phosphoglycolate phosphatase